MSEQRKSRGGVIATYVLVLAALGGFLYFWYQYQQRTVEAEEPPAPPVVVNRPQEATIANEIRFSGHLEAEDSITVLPKASGTLERMEVDVGDRVEAGQVVARIEADEYRPRVREARAAFEAAQSSLARAERLYEAGNIPEQEYEQAEAEFESAQSRYELAQLRLEDTRIKAPIAGTVIDTQASTGALLGPQTPVLTIGTVDDLFVTVEVPEEHYRTLSSGALERVAVSVPAAGGDRRRARIERVYPSVSAATKTFRTKVSLEDAQGRVTPGMFAEVYIVTREEQRRAVPIGALVSGDSLWYVDDEERARRLALEDVLASDEAVAVPEDYRNARFIVEGQHFLEEGQQVRIIEEGGGAS
jgi:RND family efflux transporter MFP subunit